MGWPSEVREARQPAVPRVPRPDEVGCEPDGPLPQGCSVVLDPGVRRPSPDVVVGGRPRRLLRLSATGARALDALCAGPVSGRADGLLARRLTDAGLATPHPRPAGAPEGVTVVVPVRDRPGPLAACLASLGADAAVVVVDDGSRDAAEVAAIVADGGATLVRRHRSGGPAAARNAGLRAVSTPLVAFCDSDCLVPPGWVGTLAGHLADPLVAAVAPRVTGGRRRSALDLGPFPGPVRPDGPLTYVPSAALVARVDALGDGFDEALRYGEDVDLVWRLVAAGWRVRYEPAVVVAHSEPADLAGRLSRRYRYGTAAAPLARRHPGHLAPAVVSGPPALAVGALVDARPAVAVAALVATGATVAGRTAASGLGWGETAGIAARAVAATWLGVGRWWRRGGAPVAAAIALPGRRGRRRTWRRVAVALTVLAPGVLARWSDRSPGNGLSRGPAPGTLAEDLAYGAGVLAGCLRWGTWDPLLPALAPAPGGRRSRPAPTPGPTPGSTQGSTQGPAPGPTQGSTPALTV